ncbi:hypothetical protein F4778DRAFT_231517 [Xylariomycetidae sp. FL2044]|nr:hypothetical protein F4778DRAFT_231517 [Xylariomycetidae sp. FL2044]
MLHLKRPGLFVLASAILLCLIAYTTRYLYHNASQAYPATPAGDIEPIKEALASPVQQSKPPVSSEPPENVTGITPTPVPKPANSPPIADDNDRAMVPMPDSKGCPPETEYLLRAGIEMGFTDRVRYTRRRIRPVHPKNFDRDHVSTIAEPLIRGLVEVDLRNCQDTKVPESAPIELEVSKPHPKTTYEHFIFGISTNYHRLVDAMESTAFWLANSRAKLVVVVVDAMSRNADEMRRLRLNFEKAGMDVILVSPVDYTLSTSQNHFNVLTNMVEHADEKTYKLRHAELTERGEMKQLYVWKGDSEKGELDEVAELVWEKD